MSADAAKRRVLIVEDEDHLAAGLKLNLELEGYQVDVAANAKEAGQRLLDPAGYDAIVVVENIHRHMSMGNTSLLEAIPPAVDEVGGPTILATFTVIAALLPMAFVSGLMGPYMSPIPINASIGMLLSLAVALVVTPWASNKLLKPSHDADHADKTGDRLDALFRRLVGPFLRGKEGRRAR